MTSLEAFAKIIKGHEGRLVLTDPARITNTKVDGNSTRFIGGFVQNSSGAVLIEINVYSERWINLKAFDSTSRRVRATKEDSVAAAQITLANWLV